MFKSWVLCSQGEYSTHWKTTVFIYDELQNIYCFTNLNQMYVEYICFGWFEYFWVSWNYDDVWKYEYDMWSLNKLCDCMWWLGIL